MFLNRLQFLTVIELTIYKETVLLLSRFTLVTQKVRRKDVASGNWNRFNDLHWHDTFFKTQYSVVRTEQLLSQVIIANRCVCLIAWYGNQIHPTRLPQPKMHQELFSIHNNHQMRSVYMPEAFHEILVL